MTFAHTFGGSEYDPWLRVDIYWQSLVRWQRVWHILEELLYGDVPMGRPCFMGQSANCRSSVRILGKKVEKREAASMLVGIIFSRGLGGNTQLDAVWVLGEVERKRIGRA